MVNDLDFEAIKALIERLKVATDDERLTHLFAAFGYLLGCVAGQADAVERGSSVLLAMKYGEPFYMRGYFSTVDAAQLSANDVVAAAEALLKGTDG